MFVNSFLSSLKGKGSLIIIIIIAIFNIFSDCSESSSPSDPTSGSVSFLMGYKGGGDFGANPGMVLVSAGGSVSLVSEYYPVSSRTAYVDINKGRIAMAAHNPPEGYSSIAYMDVNNLSDIKFIMLPKPSDTNFYWTTPLVRPQVMSDGRIIFKVEYTCKQDWNYYPDGQLAIYDPANDSLEFSGSLSDFVLGQPEQGPDTELGRMGNSFALSPDESFVCLNAFGAGIDMAQWHTDYQFIVKYDLLNKEYKRVIEGNNIVLFVSSDNSSVIAKVNDHQKYNVNINDGSMVNIDVGDDFNPLSVGQYSKKSNKFFKAWCCGGISLYDVNTGWLYDQILADNMTSYNGLGQGAQFSDDESKIYFKGLRYRTHDYSQDFAVFSTPLSLGKTDANPDTLFTLPIVYATNLFLLLHN
ncbi:hypothetical protein ACFLSQ_08230 [Bacteroidota bacterium]